MNTKIEYDWIDTGKLSIEINGNHSASVRYFPSERAIALAVEKGSFCHPRDLNSQEYNSQQSHEKSNLGHFSDFQKEETKTKYNEKHMEISRRYNKSLEEGRYEDAISCLEEMIFIAEKEKRPRDMLRLQEIKDGIRMFVKMQQRYNEKAENNKSTAQKLTQEPQQLAEGV